MGESTVEDAAAAADPKAKPTILVPPRRSMESFFATGLGSLGSSPGPMTLVSSFFAEQGPFSFSQLLAGAMASPVSPKPGFLLADSNPEREEKSDSSLEDDQSCESVGGGYKRNRPMSLVVAQPQLDSLSPLFIVPPGLSPSGLLNSPGFLSPLRSPFGMSHQQALAHVTAQAALSQSYMQMQVQIQHSPVSPNDTSTHHANPSPPDPQVRKVESSEISHSDKKASHVIIDKPAGDGYNWRKYGQKHVKASECPRSYYKCTHINCLVKKKVERSFNGRVSEIVYKGQHNHDPPQNNKRRKDRSVFETNKLNEAGEVDSQPVNLQASARQSSECRHVDGNKDEVESNVIVVDDGDDDDEPIAKRRNMDAGQSVLVSSQQTITESKIVVQTRSAVDLLDDGYKWRKYGQKVVKGNLHPRSYYRCTYAGCEVRKHVERASTDPKAVITTYDGKHNHEIPSGRYSTTNALKARKSASPNPLSPTREMDFRKQDKIVLPVTLHLKEEHIAA
ncbi:hypothetical protein OROMI_032596 [Orobanche minor]